MDTYLHKTMASLVSLEKIEIIRSQEFMPSEGRLKFLKKMIILGPKTAILGPQFWRILVLGPHFWWSGGGPGPRGPPWIRPWVKTDKMWTSWCTHMKAALSLEKKTMDSFFNQSTTQYRDRTKIS